MNYYLIEIESKNGHGKDLERYTKLEFCKKTAIRIYNV